MHISTCTSCRNVAPILQIDLVAATCTQSLCRSYLSRLHDPHAILQRPSEVRIGSPSASLHPYTADHDYLSRYAIMHPTRPRGHGMCLACNKIPWRRPSPKSSTTRQFDCYARRASTTLCASARLPTRKSTTLQLQYVFGCDPRSSRSFTRLSPQHDEMVPLC